MLGLLPLLYLLIRSVHFLQFDLGLLAQFRVIDQVTLDRLDNAFRFTVNEDSLNAEEGFFDSARVINVDIVVQVLDQHVREPGMLIR